jgi:5'-nucleotidase
MSRSVRMARDLRVPLLLVALLAAAMALATVPGVREATAAKPRKVNIQILALNDFHGNLQPPAGSSGRITLPPAECVPFTGSTCTVDAGGAEYLATWIKTLEAEQPRSIFVSAGDMIGASPLLSALFHDEPTIESFNLMQLDVNAVGNHEFDEGTAELKRLQNGGCHPVDGCQDGDGFAGASFKYLAANVVNENSGKTLFPAIKVIKKGGVRIGFIGMTLEGTPQIVTPSGVAGYDFLDEAETANHYVDVLKSMGVQAIVVLIHEGGLPTGFYNECPGISGPIVDIVNNFDSEIDLVISGHTHAAYNCVINGMPVTSSSSFGRIVTDYDLKVDTVTGEIDSIKVDNVIVRRNVALDPAQTALIAKYNAIAAPLANRVIGSITATITRTANTAGESALGDVIADAQLEATDDPGFGDAVAAFMNPGGIRADLVYDQISGGEAPGEVTYGEAFNVQPFGNSLVTMTLTGAQIDTMLEQQFDNPTVGASRILQVSDGFTYTWDFAAPTGSKVSNIAIDGVPIVTGDSYRVTVNSFLADGGDGFLVLKEGTDRLGGAVDLDALEDYFVAHSPVAPGPQNRITRLN